MRDEPTKGEGLVLSWVAGTVDGIGYVLLHVFTAHVTGDTVHLGTDVGQLDFSAAARPAFAILAFVVGVGVGAVARDACARHGIPPRPVVFGSCAALLSSFLAIGMAVGPPSDAARFYALAAPAALAMGCQNAVMPKLGGRRVRTFITGTMTEFAEALVAAARSSPGRAGSLRRALELFAVWATYVVGGVVSGLAGTRWGVRSALLPIAGFAVVVIAEMRRWHGSPASPPREATEARGSGGRG